MKRAKPRVTAAQQAARQKFLRGEDDYDPGAKLCGHGTRITQRSHYLGGGLWVCFECFAKLLLGGRKESA